MDTATDALTGVTEPGEVVLLVGRPAAGVSTILASVVSRWADRGDLAVMASWERAASQLRLDFPGLEAAEVLDIVGWTVGELERRLEDLTVGAGALVAVDYLQLIQGPDDIGARIAALADRFGLRMVLGAMAPRSVAPVVADGEPAEVLRVFAEHIAAMRGADARYVDRLAALVDGGPDSGRRLIISQRSPRLHLVDTVEG